MYAPTGWHVPSDAEWTILTTYLGGERVAGYRLKENGNAHWEFPNVGTNENGFTGLPGGFRYSEGGFGYLGKNGIWWSSSEIDADWAPPRGLNYNDGWFGRGYNRKDLGFSVRCLKD